MTPNRFANGLCRRAPFFLLVAILLAGSAGGGSLDVLLVDDFEHGLDSGWEVETFEGSTEYTVVEVQGNRALRAASHGAASGLVYRVEVEPKDYPVLAWRWKIEHTLEGGDARRKSGDDYAARVYVIFPHWFPPKTRVLNYIWANRLEEGSHVPNPFLSQAVMFAVRSGDGAAGEWVEERRNLLDDFRLAFGEAPPQIGAVAVMTDTDQTGESAVAYYDDIRLLPATSTTPSGAGGETSTPR